MFNDTGCPVIQSEDAAPKVVLRSKCPVDCLIVGEAIFVSVMPQETPFAIPIIAEWTLTLSPSCSLKIITAKRDVNMPAVM